jgi:hypothetical protein
MLPGEYLSCNVICASLHGIFIAAVSLLIPPPWLCTLDEHIYRQLSLLLKQKGCPLCRETEGMLTVPWNLPRTNSGRVYGSARVTKFNLPNAEAA